MPLNNDDDDDDADATAIFTEASRTLARPSWTPTTAPDDGGDLGSRYGGRPWIGFGAPWPACATCAARMAFAVQLDLATLPEGLGWPHRGGLVQLFLCGRCMTSSGRWIATSALATAGVGRSDGAERDNPAWQPARIIGWTAGPVEVPGYEDPAWQSAFDNYDEVSLELVDLANEAGLDPHGGDRIGGWPRFTQDPGYPPCPRCAKPTRHLLQVASNGLAGFQLGDLGTGHLMQCAEHPDGVAFVWSSN